MICKSIKKCSSEVFEWISKQKEVGEESITDWSLYRASDLDGRIQYLQFNRHEEGKFTGADFELWILTKTIFFKARVQAKRLRSGKDLYPSIAHSNKYGLQIDKLITDANSDGFRPLYAFYSSENYKSQCRRDIKNEGIYMADANTIYSDIFSVPKRKIYSSHLISKSTPFSCWFCCPLSSKNGAFLRFLNSYYPTTSQDGNYPNGITDKLPGYVSEILNFKKQDTSEFVINYDLRKEFRNLENVSGIMIIDNRDE